MRAPSHPASRKGEPGADDPRLPGARQRAVSLAGVGVARAAGAEDAQSPRQRSIRSST